jgi:hypothetical protein
MSLEEIIKKHNIPNKTEFFATTSYKFKSDILDYFSSSIDKVFIEFGTSRGYTSAFASELFKTVHTVNNNIDFKAQNYLNKIDNVNQHWFDLYNTSFDFVLNNLGKGDVFLSDAQHTTNAVIIDTKLAKHLSNDNSYIVYDDYGLYRGIREAVEILVEDKVIEIIKFIGEEKGWQFDPSSRQRVLQDREGVICKIL